MRITATHPLYGRIIARPDVQRQLAARGAVPITTSPGPRKYHNEPCEVSGQRFDSKQEARDYARLIGKHGAANVIRQVSFPIGARRIRPDFLIVLARHEDGSFTARLADSKGAEPTDAWRAKANHLTDKHGLSIQILKT